MCYFFYRGHPPWFSLSLFYVLGYSLTHSLTHFFTSPHSLNLWSNNFIDSSPLTYKIAHIPNYLSRRDRYECSCMFVRRLYGEVQSNESERECVFECVCVCVCVWTDSSWVELRVGSFEVLWISSSSFFRHFFPIFEVFGCYSFGFLFFFFALCGCYSVAFFPVRLTGDGWFVSFLLDFFFFFR